MKRRFVLFGISIILVSFICFYVVHNAGAQKEELTKGEFITRLVKSLDLEYRLPDNPTFNDYVAMLKKEGINVPEDLDPNSPITVEEKTEFINQALSCKMFKKSISMPDAGKIYRNKAVVDKIVGDVNVKVTLQEDWHKASEGMILNQDSTIKTGSGSYAFLRIGVGSIKILENTEIYLQSLSTQKDTGAEVIIINLAMGSAVVDARDLSADSEFEVVTPTVIAAVRGTIYKVEVLEKERKTLITNP